MTDQRPYEQDPSGQGPSGQGPSGQDPSGRDPFESRTRAAFDASVEALDGRTRSKLNQARQAALQELRTSASRPWQRVGTALAGLSAAVLAVWIAVAQWTPPSPGELALDDMDLVAEAPNLELLEDVEFYAWVARERSQGDLGQVNDGSG